MQPSCDNRQRKIQAMNTPAKLKENLIKGSIIDLHIEVGKERFFKYLQEAGFKPVYLDSNSIRILVSKGKQTVPQLFKAAEKMKIEICSISMHEPSLEDVFIHYTGKAIRDEAGESTTKQILRAFR